MILLPGDALVYRPSSPFGWAIAVKSGHSLSHVEIYVGDARSVASRDGIGTGEYPVRLDHVAFVCRPKAPINVAKGLAWFRAQPHRAYGWRDLMWFFDVPVPRRWSEGVVCSPFGDEFWCACDFDAFNQAERPERIFPYEFTVTPRVDVLPFVLSALSV